MIACCRTLLVRAAGLGWTLVLLVLLNGCLAGRGQGGFGDTTAPVISFSLPQNSTIADQTVMTISISESGSGLLEYSLDYADPLAFADIVGTNTTGNLTSIELQFSILLLSAGTYAISVTARDKENNIAQANFNFIVAAGSGSDFTLPNVGIHGIGADLPLNGDVVVTIIADDTGSGIASVQLYIDDVEVFSEALNPTVAQYMHEYTLQDDKSMLGMHSIRAQVRDGAGLLNQQELFYEIVP
jgi:hypothetical protein